MNRSIIPAMRRLLPMIATFAVAVCLCRAANPAERPELTSIAEIRSLREFPMNRPCALRLTGIVTLVDAGRKMLVLQDASGALALHAESSALSARPGDRVVLEASDCSPYVASLPGFPFQPSGRDVRAVFETPRNEGSFRLTRMRGWLRPPVTGNYTFWIASDDSSELWLSTSADPARAARIAYVPPSGWTDPRDWSRFSAQRSETMFLRMGESYFIEAIQEQHVETSHLSVAWEGPELKQAVIDGRFVFPWQEGGEVPPAGPDASMERGILREYWTDHSAGSLSHLKSGSVAEVGLTVRGMRLARLAGDVWPDPQPFDPGQPLAQEDCYRWVEGEGSVSFMGSDGVSATLELAVAGNRLLVRVAGWHGELPTLGPHLRARFRGVREGVRDANAHLMTGLISVPSEQQVSFFEEPQVPPQVSAPQLADPVAAGPGGYFFTRGVVTFNDLVRGRKCLFIQDARNGIFVSQAERQLPPLLQVGQAVQIGGPLLPGRYAPGILPAGFTILGWQNLPVPAIPAEDAPEASCRDGQWTAFDGVVRAVNPDGMLALAGKRMSIPVWVGHTDRRGLEQLVNRTLSVRGVMSLEMFGTPTLLVPSRSYVEIKEPAPELPAVPVPVASLNHAASGSSWVHQVKVAGRVTFRNDRFFYLQDSSGSVRVQPGTGPSLRIGSALEVVGFPGIEGSAAQLTEATWHPHAASPPIVPARLDLRNSAAAGDGRLAQVEARLLSRDTRGADHILELQTDGQVFKAVLETPAGKLPELAAGSLLALTGVCLLDNTSPPATQLRLLLRSPDDVTLLQGPPWWTWKQTVVLMGVLLAVLAGSLLRIQILSRRFTRQQAARLAFARGMLESQESERRRIATSLHDSLGQDLLVIRNQAHLAIQSSAGKSDLRQRLEDISTTTLQAINEVREITHNLRPYQLDRLGLTQSIRAVTRKVSEDRSVIFACHVDEIDGMFDKESEIHIYRIVQEGINNVLKHSQATEAAVVVKAAPGHLSISIRDNGIGFPANGSSSDAGFGLSGIRERAEIMRGTAKIDSSPGQGVNLQVQLPLQPASQ